MNNHKCIRRYLRTAIQSLLAFGMVLAVTANGAVLKVGSGLDTTIPGNYDTISAAISAASAGDVIQVGSGVYNENFTIPNNVIVKGAGPNLTEVLPQVVLGFRSTVMSMKIGQIRISGSEAKILDVLVRGAILYYSGTQTGVIIANSKITDGIDHQGLTGVLVIGNHIGKKLRIAGGVETSIIGNTISDLESPYIEMLSKTRIFANNLVIRSGIPLNANVFDYPTTVNRVENNTFTMSPDQSPGLNVTSTWKNNIIVAAQEPFSLDSNKNFIGDPGFVDSENSDYRLSETSPAIDAGYSFDPDGSVADLGAYGGVGAIVWQPLSAASGQPVVGPLLLQPNPVAPGEPIRLQFQAWSN